MEEKEPRLLPNQPPGGFVLPEVRGQAAGPLNGIMNGVRMLTSTFSLVLQDLETLPRVFGDELYFSPDAAREAVLHQSCFNVIHNESLIKIDFMIRKREDYRLVEFGRRQLVWSGIPSDLSESERRDQFLQRFYGQVIANYRNALAAAKPGP